MDDLEAVWGPHGRATVDPSTIRPVPPRPAAPDPPVPAPFPIPGPPRPFAGDGSGAADDRDLLRAPPSPPARPAVPGGWFAVVAMAGVALVAVLGASQVGGSGRPAPTRDAPLTATTIVSAAADLLGRATTTVRPTTSTTEEVEPPSTSTPAPSAPSATTATVPHLADAERVAQRFVEVIAAGDCDGLWSLLSGTSQRFLTSAGDPGGPDGRTLLCEGIRSERERRVIVVRGPATARADGAAAVTLESSGEVEELVLVHEDGRWVVDLFAAMGDES